MQIVDVDCIPFKFLMGLLNLSLELRGRRREREGRRRRELVFVVATSISNGIIDKR